MSRALGGLYGGRVSCHGSIMYGTRSRVPRPERVSWARGLCRLAGWSFVQSVPSAGRSIRRT